MSEQTLDNMVRLTDELTIDMDFLPIDIIIDFVDHYQSLVKDKEKELFDNAVLAAIRLTRSLQKTNLLNDVLKWAAPDEDQSTLKKKVKSKYEIGLYLNMQARIEDYFSIKYA